MTPQISRHSHNELVVENCAADHSSQAPCLASALSLPAVMDYTDLELFSKEAGVGPIGRIEHKTVSHNGDFVEVRRFHGADHAIRVSIVAASGQGL